MILIHDGLDVWMDVYVNYGITYIAFVLYVPSMSPSLPLSNKINQSILFGNARDGMERE